MYGRRLDDSPRRRECGGPVLLYPGTRSGIRFISCEETEDPGVFFSKFGSEALYLERRGFLEFFLMNILDNFKCLLFLMFLVSNVLCKPWSLDLCLSVSHLKCRYTKKISLSLSLYLFSYLSIPPVSVQHGGSSASDTGSCNQPNGYHSLYLRYRYILYD